jgi:capsule biosynthesis phosphatase
MINKEKVIVIDLDGTIAQAKDKNQEYINVKPNHNVVQKLKQYRENGFYIIIVSSRNMRTFEGNIGKINNVTLKTMHKWLDKHNIPYDEIHIGRPWCGYRGFYVDDKTVRPDEFVNFSLEEINRLIS